MKLDLIDKKLNLICKFVSYSSDIELNKKHSSDWRGRFTNISLGVVFPNSTFQVSKIVKFANKHNISLIPQGGNTGLVGGTSPSKNKMEIILSLEKMNKIFEIDDENRSIELQAGVIIENASSILENKDFIFPLNMSSIGSSQVGGAIATNAGGMNVIKYGSIRNNILAVEVVLANGEILSLGSNLIKDNTGYNLKDIFCGSEGTLGIITKARMKIYPKPFDYATCFISVNSIDKVINIFKYINKNFSEKIERVEFISDLSFELCIKHHLLNKRFFQKKTKYYLLIKFIYFNNSQMHLESLEKLFVAQEDNCEEFLLAQNEKESLDFWKFRESLTEAQKIDGKLLSFDISVPINNIESFLKQSKKQISELIPNIKFHIFGHLGDSNIHFNLIEPDNFKKDFYKYEKKMKKIVNRLIVEFKGSVSAEHGIGMLKKDDLKKTKNIKEIELMKKIKKLLDPKNILNKGKIF
jgi:FAD/FMN-containing dehydrogenase